MTLMHILAQTDSSTSIDIVEVISKLGFPIAVAVAFGYALVWTIKFLVNYIIADRNAWKSVAEKQMERGDKLENTVSSTYEQSLLTNKLLDDLTAPTRTRARPK